MIQANKFGSNYSFCSNSNDDYENVNEMTSINNAFDTINRIQIFCRKYNINNINFPEIVVIGAQSTGKSSILERIISCDILPKNKEICTKCPIILQLSSGSNNDEIMAVFLTEKNQCFKGETLIRQKIQEITNAIKGISKDTIIIQLSKKDFPKLTLVDLPGLIKNSDKEHYIMDIEKLAETHAKSQNSIILAVSAANVDLANSDSIKISRKFDPEGKRTIHVITKIDMMDEGTDARDILKNDFVSKSLGVILMKNRNQKKLLEKQTMAEIFYSEQKFLDENYPEISREHGISVLISKLVENLHRRIKNLLPEIRDGFNKSKNELKSKIKRLDKSDKDINKICIEIFNKFIRIYKDIIFGDKSVFENQLSGGALISIAIYDEFEKTINDLKIDDFENDYIRNLMRNTAGNRKTSYSIEKSYLPLSMKLIEKCFGPTQETLKSVKELQIKFVEQAIKEMDISRYNNLNIYLKDKMHNFIDNQYKQAAKITQLLIDCEINNVPNTYKIENYFQYSKSDTNSRNYDDEDDDDNHQKNELLIEMVIDNFKDVQENIICNFPKWVQKLMINDLLETMEIDLLNYKEEPSYLLKLNEKNKNELRKLKNELKEIETIEDDLNECLKGL